MFNPFFLALENKISMIVRGLAIIWARDILETQIENHSSGIPTKNLFENLVWATIEIVTIHWWENLIDNHIDKTLPEYWISIKKDIKNLLNNHLLPFPEE